MFGEGQGWGEVGIERGRVRTRRGGGGTPIHYLHGYVPPKGVMILKLPI